MTTNVFLSFLGISVSVSLIIVILLLCMPVLNKRYAAKWEYWIWIFLALRLLLPFSGTDIRSMADNLSQRNTHSTFNSEKSITDSPSEQRIPQGRVTVEIPARMTAPIAVSSEICSKDISLLDVTAFVWVLGALTFLSVHLISYFHYKSQVLKRGRAVTDIYILRQLFRLKRELQIKDTILMVEYPEAASPMILGFIKPVLVLPEERYSAEELYFILKHELVHLKRRDVCMKLLFTAANAVHWFNPLVWIMQKEASVDMELSCDERVTQGTDHAMRKAYTETLLSTLHKRCAKKTVLSTQFYGGKQIMKKRFKNILIRTGKKNGMAVLLCAVILTVGLGTLVGCSVSNEDAEGASGQRADGNIEGSAGLSGNGGTEDASGQTGSGGTEGASGQTGSGNAEGASGQAGNGNAVGAQGTGNGQSAQGTDGNGAGNSTSNTGEGNSAQIEKLVYIDKFDGEKIIFDEIEWVQVPGERASELGLTEDDAPSGFSVYNSEAVKEELSLSSDCTCTLLDWTSNYAEMQVTLEELADILAEREEIPVPYHITVRNNEIISIIEQYVP